MEPFLFPDEFEGHVQDGSCLPAALILGLAKGTGRVPAACPMLFSILSRYSENDNHRVWRNMGPEVL